MRFPGFDGGWVEKKLGEVAEISSGGTPSRANPNYWNGNIPWVSTSLIDFNVIYNSDEKITPEGLKKSSAKLFPKGSLLMAMYGQGKTRGKIAVLGIEATTNQACASIVVKDNILESLFLFQNLSKRYDEIRELSNQGGQQNLSGTIIKQLEVSIPILQEQQKIANFLSLIDVRINTQSKILLQYQSLIKNIRDNLFRQKIRFKNDNKKNFPDWNTRKLSDIANIKMGQSPDSITYNYQNFGFPLIQGNADIKDRKSNPRQYTTNPTKLCEIGDLILTVRAPVGYVAKSLHNACLGRGVCSIKSKKDSLPEFIYQFLLHFENKWKSIEQGSTFTSVSSSDISSVDIKTPCIEEQEKLATFLSSLDKKIETEKALLNQYELQKWYLLQQMVV